MDASWRRHVVFLAVLLSLVVGGAFVVHLLPNCYIRSILTIAAVACLAAFTVYWYRFEFFLLMISPLYDEQQHKPPEDL